MKKFVLLILIAGMLLFGCAQSSQGTAGSGNSGGNSAGQTIQNESGVAQMTVKKGDVVRVDYVGTLENGTMFDTSIREEAVKGGIPLRSSYSPLEFTVGAGQMIAGFDNAVVGMKVGEEKTVTLKPSEAYGEANPQNTVTVNKSEIGGGGDLGVGTQLSASNGMAGVVTAIENDSVTVDFNHPLAGKTLVFRIILRGIVK